MRRGGPVALLDCAFPWAEASFVHLHVHSEYSILDGACRFPALAARAAEFEMPAVGLTDHGSMAGAIELYREAGPRLAARRRAAAPWPIAESSCLRNFLSWASATARSFPLAAFSFNTVVLLRLNLPNPFVRGLFKLIRTPASGRTGFWKKSRKLGENVLAGSFQFAQKTGAGTLGLRQHDRRTVPQPKGGIFMAETVTHSLVHQFAAMKPTDFGATIEPKWQVADRLMKEVRSAVEKKQLTPLDGARVISSIAATLFGYDEFILREISPETLLAASSRR